MVEGSCCVGINVHEYANLRCC